MPLADPYGVLIDTFDLESIEILRGPQGILFGRNATGGAVVVRTRRPSDSFEFVGAVRFGNADRFDQSAYVSGPTAGSRLKGKLTVLHRKGDGLNEDENADDCTRALANPERTWPAGNHVPHKVGGLFLIKRTAPTM